MSKSQDGIEVVHLNGDLDYQNAQELKKQLTDLVAAGHSRLVIDLAAVSSIDSSGLGALVGGLKAARSAGGGLQLAAPNDQVRRVLALTTLDRILKSHLTVEEAAAALS